MAQRKQRRWNLLVLVALLLALVLALFSVAGIELDGTRSRDNLRLASTPRALTTKDGSGSLLTGSRERGDRLMPAEMEADQREFDEARFHVYLGIYTNNNYSVDLRIPSYVSSGYVWMNWDGEMQRYLEELDLPIQQLIVPINVLDSNPSSVLKPVGVKPLKLPGGRYYQMFTYQGSFYIDNVDFRRFPFLEVNLPLVFEANDPEGGLDYGNLRLLPELKDSGMGLYAGIIGFLTQGWSMAEYRHHYATNFGLGGAEADYSQVIFDLGYGASAWSSFWRLLLPLAVVMAMVLLVSKLRNDLQDVRSTIPVTILLTLVFLQQSYRSSLPDLPYLAFLDRVYVVAYLLTLVAFVLVIWIGKRSAEVEQLPDELSRQTQINRLERVDDIWPLVVVVVGIISVGLCWFTIPMTAIV
jgi:hypothetical protein